MTTAFRPPLAAANMVPSLAATTLIQSFAQKYALRADLKNMKSAVPIDINVIMTKDFVLPSLKTSTLCPVFVISGIGIVLCPLSVMTNSWSVQLRHTRETTSLVPATSQRLVH